MPNLEQELRDDFTKMLGKYGLSDEQIDNLQVEILVLVKKYLPELAKEAGHVKLAEDQTLPIGVFDYEQHGRIFKEAGWRRVE